MSPIGQQSNDQMKAILASEFQQAGDPSYMARIAISKYLNIPGIRGLWGPAVRVDGAGIYSTDLTGGGFHMSWLTGGPMSPMIYSQSGRLAWYLNGVTFATNPDSAQWDITTTEAWIGDHGIAMGAWINPTRVIPYAGEEGIIGKWLPAGNQLSYSLHLDQANGNRATVKLSTTGANWYAFDHTKVLARDRWYFIAMTFNPDAVLGETAGVRIWVNDKMEYHAISDRASGAPGLPASIFNSSAALQLASFGGGANMFLGYQTDWFIIGNYILEGEIFNAFESTKNLMGFVNEKGTSY